MCDDQIRDVNTLENLRFESKSGALPVGPVVIWFISHRLGALHLGIKRGDWTMMRYWKNSDWRLTSIVVEKFLRRKRKEADEEKKRSYIIKYMNPIGEALQEILGFQTPKKMKR